MSVLSCEQDPLTTRALDIGDATIAVDIAGAGPAVVCIAGLDGRAGFWRRQVAVLAPHHTLVMYDQRGAGRSSHSRIRYSVAQMADDLLSILDALDIERATLLGHGLGSLVALQLAAGAADRIEQMILGAPWAGPSPCVIEQEHCAQQILSLCGAETYAQHQFMRAVPASWLHSRSWLIAERVAERLAGLAATETEISRLQAAIDCDLSARLTNVRVRTLVVAAADDQVVPHAVSRAVAGAMPNAQFEPLLSGGHLFPEVASDAYNALLAQFIDE